MKSETFSRTLLPLLWLLALPGVQAQDYEYTINDDTVTITGYTGAGGAVTIPATIEGLPVTTIGDHAFRSRSNLTSVTIPDSVGSIGNSAFNSCNGMTNLTLGNGVTSIGQEAFNLCRSLTSVTIPDSVTIIGDSAFSTCDGLTSLTIGKGVTSIGSRAFYNCGNLTSVMIPDGVGSIGDSAFNSCNGMADLTIGNSVTSIGQEAFNLCRSLTSVTIPDSVTIIGDSAFSYCDGLTSLTIGKGVTRILKDAFSGCGNLTILYFEGNAPNAGPWSLGGSQDATVFYLAGTTGWFQSYGGHPTRLTTGTLDPLIGGLDLAEFESWFVSVWFWAYSTAFAPWIYHAEHGFLYRYPESTSTSTYFYDDAMGVWWWSTSDFYPAIYAFDPPADNAGTDIGSEWVWYEKYTRDPRSFSVLTGDLAGTTLYYGP